MNTVEKLRNPEYLGHHPLLLLGGEGLVGSGLKRSLAGRLSEEALRVASRSSSDLKVDLADYSSVRSLIRQIQPGLIIHLAGATNVDGCEKDPDLAFKVNVEGMRNILEEADGTPLVYFSTDFVFDGSCPRPYLETDMPNPVSVYGQSKLAAEMLFLDSGNPGFIARLSYPWQPMGFHLANPHLKDTLWWMATELLGGRQVEAFTNVVGSWTPLEEMSDHFWELTQKMIGQKQKLIHLAGSQSLSAFDVAQLVRKRLDIEEELSPKLGTVVPVRHRPMEGESAIRPVAGGLDTTLAKKLGLSLTPIGEAIAKDWFDIAVHGLE